MAGVISNIIRGAKFSYDLQGGTRPVRYFITGLNPEGDPLVEAAFVAGVPQIYSFYPFFPTNMYCVSVDFEPYPDNSKTSVMATAQFKSPTVDLSSGYQIKINGTTINKTLYGDPSTITAANPAGQPFSVDYTDPVKGTELGPQFFGIDDLVSHTVLEFTRIEPQPPQDVLTFTSKMNSDQWQGGKPGTWRVRPPNAELLNQNAYRVTRSFEYALEGWTSYKYFQLPTGPNGGIPNDCKLANPPTGPANGQFGIYVYVPQSSAFASYNLPVVFKS